jgi:nicotinamide phosphoribosyltransferase
LNQNSAHFENQELYEMLNDNLIKITDSYKIGHHKQYPPHTTLISSYFEARVGGEYDEVVFFGLQYFLKRYLEGEVITQKKIDDADKFWSAHLRDNNVFNRKGWEHILNEHGGKLPIRIRAVSEGTVVPEGNAMLIIENTCPDSFWLTNYLESLLVEIWYGCTTATISREMKKIIWAALERSGTATLENLLYRLHDFGLRGSTSPESAAIGGSAHLVNFLGTDTGPALDLLIQYYNIDMPGFSINAAEHSTITSWGWGHELEAFRNILEQFPTGLVAVVSDSYDIRNAVENLWGGILKDKILARDGLLVIRPDSGDPKIIIPELLEIIDRKFGSVMNEKGYRVINDKIRLIQGDGISRHTLAGILNAIMDKGWSADCISFGSGGGLLQDCNRDTQRMAMKCSYAVVDGVGRDVFKQPVTDPTKNSKRGQLMLIETLENGKMTFKTVPMRKELAHEDKLLTVYENGKILIDQDLADIRERAMI